MAISVFKNTLRLLCATAITGFTFSAGAQTYMPSQASKYYLQCTAKIANSIGNVGYKNDRGMIGLFQLSAYQAYKGGLCDAPVPQMHQVQVWKLCDFKGPVAVKYNLHSQYDLRFDVNARQAQAEIMRNLNNVYNGFIYDRKYETQFNKYVNSVLITPELLRGMYHAKGKATVDAFMHGQEVRDRKGKESGTLAVCLDQCFKTQAKIWLCD